MTKMAAMPVHVCGQKNLKNPLFYQKSHDLENWHGPSGTRALNDESWLTVTYHGKVKFGQNCLLCFIAAYTKPRYQVSVYRTIGPLFFVCMQKYRKVLHLKNPNFLKGNYRKVLNFRTPENFAVIYLKFKQRRQT